MPLKVPPELKKITPYIRRAEELDKDKSNAESRLVAYYCRQHAVHYGISLTNSDEGKSCLGEILGALEGEKAAMDSFTQDEAKFLCQTFAEKIFEKADTEDRDGNATRNTAKTFYAAASFLEILQQFYQDDDESEENQEIKKRSVYAKWKATDILKAIKEGRDPTPGGYGEADADEKEEGNNDTPDDAPGEVPKVETASDDEPDVEPIVRMPSPSPPPSADEGGDEEEEEMAPPPYTEPPPSYSLPPAPTPAPAPLRPPITFSPPPVPPPMPAPPSAPPSAPTASRGIFGGGSKKKATKAQLADARELTQFALAALEDKNAGLAADRLAQALQVLGR